MHRKNKQVLRKIQFISLDVSIDESIVVFPVQYLGSRAPEPVKKKVLEMLHSWTVTLPEETKIADAYCMLKKQGGLKISDVVSLHVAF